MEVSTLNKIILIAKPIILAAMYAIYTIITHRKFAILYIMTSFYAIIYSLSDYVHAFYLGVVHFAQVFETPWYISAMPYVLPAVATALTGVFIGRRMKIAQAVKTEEEAKVIQSEAKVIEGDAMSKMQENYLVMIEHVNAQLSDITEDNKLLRAEVDKLQLTIKERDAKIDELLAQLRLYIRDEH